jgi:hypothetical protein
VAEERRIGSGVKAASVTAGGVRVLTMNSLRSARTSFLAGLAEAWMQAKEDTEAPPDQSIPDAEHLAGSGELYSLSDG